MLRTNAGLIWSFTFVGLEAVQAVYFGGVFQDLDAFLIGAVVFGSTAAAALLWTWVFAPCQLRRAACHRRALLGLNLSTLVVWIAYFHALERVEPAIVFACFSGLIPVFVVIAGRLGWDAGATQPANGASFGLTVVVAGVSYFAIITLMGFAGFVRGGVLAAFAGLVYTALASASLVAMILVSRAFDRLGLGVVAQYGLRFPLYVVIAGLVAALGWEENGPVHAMTVLSVSLIGVLIIAFPVFAMQKAIVSLPSFQLAAITALGPIIVFAFQLVEGRVDYAPATLIGLLIYAIGAVLLALNGRKSRA